MGRFVKKGSSFDNNRYLKSFTDKIDNTIFEQIIRSIY